MPLNPGVLTVTFDPPGAFVVDRLHTVPASSGLSTFTQTGCTKQTVTVKDQVKNTAYSEATNKFFTPYNADTATVGAEWYAHYGGKNYRVLGSDLIPDGWGRITYCTFICKQEGG